MNSGRPAQNSVRPPTISSAKRSGLEVEVGSSTAALDLRARFMGKMFSPSMVRENKSESL